MKENKEKIKESVAWWQPAIQLFAQISGWIVFPIIIAIYLGRWLDEKYNREVFYYFICVGIAFVVSNIGLIMTSISTMKKLKKLDDKDNSQKPQTKNIRDK